MDEWSTQIAAALIGFVAVITVVLLFWIIALSIRLKKLRRQYVNAMGNTGVANLEEVIIEMRNELEMQRENAERLQEQLQSVQKALPKHKSKIGLHRYNAFSEQGSRLSFSIAFLDERRNGAVLSGIHNRDNTFLYAKPVEKGESSYPLTPEEQKAIEEAE